MRISDWSSDVCSSDLLECGIAVASGARVTEQARFVQHRERYRIQLERVLVGVAVAQVSAIDRELRGALQCVAPALFVAQDQVAHGTREIIVFGDRADQHAAAGFEPRSEENTSELQSLKRIPEAVFCLQ